MNRLFLVGMGPGDLENMTAAAIRAIEEAELLCGYSVYLDLIRDRWPEKETYTSPMTEELARCRYAVEQALAGRTVAMLCSGDAGIYGMAGPVLDLAAGKELEIEVIPGITAAVSGAALLGAPLMNDFCVLSLSDYLTPWSQIEKRLRCAAAGDFTVVLYNPRSRRRPDHLRKACEILLEHRASNTVCGWVRNVGRDGQQAQLLALEELKDADLDMFCTAFIGSSDTRIVGGRMLCPRGYGAGV